jgi:hypothetical protein
LPLPLRVPTNLFAILILILFAVAQIVYSQLRVERAVS